jgi:hypothetical protein
LENVSRSIAQSFSESTPAGCVGARIQPQETGTPSLVEQILTDMDKKFTDLLKQEEGCSEQDTS